MLITYKSGSVVEHEYICEYHKNHPFEVAHAGCGCSKSYVLKTDTYSKCDECDPVRFPLCNKYIEE